LRVGICGAGFLAATRVRCWRRVHGVRVELVAICAQRRERAEAFAQAHGVAAVCADAEQLVARPDVDVVDLCVPNRQHRPLAVLASHAHKHVICTKPLSAYVGQDLGADATEQEVARTEPSRMRDVALADADAMLLAAREGGRDLLYGENWIWAPAYAKAVELAAAAKAPVLEMHGSESHSGSHSPFSKQWRNAGGGALLRLGSHAVGAMLAWKHAEGLRLLGRPTRCVAVTAEVADLSRHPALTASNTRIATGWGEVESWGFATLHFDDGSRAIAGGSDNVLGGMQSRLVLRGSSFGLELDLSPHAYVRAYASEPRGFGDAYLLEKLDTQAGWSTPMPDEDWTSGQQGMLQAFALHLCGRHALPAYCDGELGREVVRVVYSAYESARTGRRVTL
jgi:predicted dehydrogenase